jgi:hypothetical protein
VALVSVGVSTDFILEREDVVDGRDDTLFDSMEEYAVVFLSVNVEEDWDKSSFMITKCLASELAALECFLSFVERIVRGANEDVDEGVDFPLFNSDLIPVANLNAFANPLRSFDAIPVTATETSSFET